MRQVIDPAIPVMAVLMGRGGTEIVSAALAGEGLVTGSIRVRQVRYVPGSSLVVQCDVPVAWSSGHQSVETFVMSFGRRHRGDVPVVEIDGHEVTVWRFPDDPYLPGLRAAMDPEAVLRVFRELGVDASDVSLRRRAYRPSRRAVVEATTRAAKLYLKVVRPDRAGDLQRRHTSMSGVIPVPRSHGWNRKLGFVVLEALSGHTLRSVLGMRDQPLPTTGQIVALLDALPSPPAVPTIVSGPATRAAEFANVISAVMPELADEIVGITTACAVVTPEDDTVPVHGDYHSSQILVEDGAIAGLVDVDSAGLGHRVHDCAQLLAHLAVLGQESPEAQFNIYGQHLISTFDRLVDPVQLRLNVAGAVLGFATGPFRVQESDWPSNTRRRVDLATEWVRSAVDAS